MKKLFVAVCAAASLVTVIPAPASAQGTPGTCRHGELQPWAPTLRPDRNGNGWVCQVTNRNGRARFTDDRV